MRFKKKISFWQSLTVGSNALLVNFAFSRASVTPSSFPEASVSANSKLRKVYLRRKKKMNESKKKKKKKKKKKERKKEKIIRIRQTYS